MENQLFRLQSFLGEVCKVKGPTVIIGDLNIDVNMKNTHSSHYKSLNPLRDILEHELVTCGFRQLISKDTRFQKGQKSSLLDHVYLRGNMQQLIRQFDKNLLGDDHNMVGLSFRTNFKIVPQI